MTKISSDPVSWERYLLDSVVPRSVIDDFLYRPRWCRFDAELGYVLHDSLVQWGIDDTRAIETLRPDGARSRFLYPGRPPRINSYGNSFTECNQVSDGETWQEYLAGHLAEPIGNYGVGGYGVYQSYRRMLRTEKTDSAARYLILYVWGDDSIRSLLRCRWAMGYPWHRRLDETSPWKGLFHGNPWPYTEMDLSTGSFVDRDNPLSTPESLYRLCDPDWMLESLRGDLALQLRTFAGEPEFGLRGRVADLDRSGVSQLADALQFSFVWNTDDEARRSQALKLLNLYGQRATNAVLDRARRFAHSSDKKLLVVLNYTARMDSFQQSKVPYDGIRNDQLVVDHLAAGGFDYFDMNAVHQREFESCSGSYAEYMKQYQVGAKAAHYNPRGNHFFAYAVKDKLVEMLDPKPVPYQQLHAGAIDFCDYLPGA